MEKRICILYTGGTIGMVPTPRGYAPRPGYLGPLLAAMPELTGPEAPAWDLVEMDPLLDSSNIAVGEWNAVGRAIFERYNDYDGFVVLHGTDTMAYTAGALSFMLENLQKPVVLTGSQIPLCRLRSDGRENLITSLLIAADGRASEVCLYFGGKLLRGCRAVKRSADGLQAFFSPNYPPLALAGVNIRYDNAALRHPAPEGPPALAPFDNVPIGVLKVFPGIQFDLFEPIMTRRLRGIVLETFGAGNIPDEHKRLSSERVIIRAKSQSSETYWKKGFVEVNLCVPDVNSDANLIRLALKSVNSWLPVTRVWPLEPFPKSLPAVSYPVSVWPSQ